jgi:acyl-CoA thioesterase II
MADASLLLEVLEVERLDDDVFRTPARDLPSPTNSLFGGQVAAQALRSAYQTVPDERVVHSLHGYFLRPGVSDRPVRFDVQRSRDGGSFSQRNVLAIQDDKVIFTTSCSFHRPERGVSFEARKMPDDLVQPEALVPTPDMSYFHEVVDLRYLTSRFAPDARPGLWARTEGPLPDDRIVHECVLVYLSDYSSGFRGAGVEGLPDMGPSLDHAVWFHAPHRMDEWTFFDLWPMWAGSGRGLYQGAMFARSGVHVATMAQESLLRPSRDGRDRR